jgi:hypothetical protein
MLSFVNDVWEWLYQAEEARKAAERLTDPDAKEVMLQLGQLYLHLAQAAVEQARVRGANVALATHSGPLH